MPRPIKLYGGKLSGHSHRVELLLGLLSRPYELILTPPADRRTSTFLAMNPFGQIPVIDDDGVIVADSNAILVYLAKRYDEGKTWLPEDPVGAAAVQRWLSVAAGQLAYGPATARLGAVFKLPVDHSQAAEIASRLFGVMDSYLAEHSFLAAGHPTLADLACYSYTRAAPDGGIALSPYTKIVAWLEKMESLPQFQRMPNPPAG
ncbi:glutathione S-transferase N-terminal domain-containing protein [Bradyrhizobium barranii]|uniref:Glutathione S-transferase N-terminal domain-containing protein n=1 Tax=Bradyrhizobium barranii TaxID=2992140 RepID=A0ABY3QQZ8_9BRAD|nr:glutathione S-transferase N-terminal domain-containing protein [Bradyrhizobium japonicum]UFW88446.1 glutathione S-transferase N-terminal domain-containing protein [Bradyrhizobium japonicum]